MHYSTLPFQLRPHVCTGPLLEESTFYILNDIYFPGIILVMGSVNGRRCYIVASSLISGIHRKNDPWFYTYLSFIFYWCTQCHWYKQVPTWPHLNLVQVDFMNHLNKAWFTSILMQINELILLINFLRWRWCDCIGVSQYAYTPHDNL